MPELPEVETIRRSLTPHLVGNGIAGLTVLRGDVIKHPDAGSFSQSLVGQQFASLSRRGKYLSLDLLSGDQLVVHLRMTGQLTVCGRDLPLLSHTHLLFDLTDGRQLRYRDIRRFGCLWLLKSGEADMTGRQNLGPEPLSAGFDAKVLQARAALHKTTVKQALLDQSVLAGLGNIYADEALYQAHINPARSTLSLGEGDWQALAAAIVDVLTASIEHCGTSFSDYRDGNGQKGDNLAYLQVYGREGQACLCCGQTIVRQKIAGRSSFYCPNCQKREV